jgi:16S rRNA (guanine(527)-N(7))-methyltransferase RsmG
VFAELLGRLFPLNPAQAQALASHYELLLRWNRVLNLTRITDLGEAVERHYAESLFVASHLPAGAWRIADIGSGGGFPGFPIAVYRPECSVTLVEAHQRKAVFLKEASRNQPNVAVLAKRAEEVAGQFDWTVSRAVSHEDLAGILGRLAPRTALLTGYGPPPVEMGFAWEERIPVPWGRQDRFLRIGTVSRETQ